MRRRWLVATILLFVGLLSAQIVITYAVGIYGANEGQRFWFTTASGAVRAFEAESYALLEQDLADLRKESELRELVAAAPDSVGDALREEWPAHDPDDFLLVTDSDRIAVTAGISPCVGADAPRIDPTRPRQLAMCGSRPVLLAQVPSDGTRRIVVGRVLGPEFVAGVKQVTGNEIVIVGTDGVVVHTLLGAGEPSKIQLGAAEMDRLLRGPAHELTHLRIPVDRYDGFGAPRFSAGFGSVDAWVYALPLDDRNDGARIVLVVPRAVFRAEVDYESEALVFAGIVFIALASMIASRWIRRLVGPIEELGRTAEAVASGDFETRIPEHGDAEIVALQASFNRMTAEIGARSKLLEDRNRKLRLVLDHVADGLFVLDRTGRLQGAASAALVAWFGEPEHGAPAWEYFGAIAPAFAESFELGWLAVSDDFVSLDLALDQLPHAFSARGRSYEVAYDPVLDKEGSAFVLAVVRDVTAQLAQDEADAAQHQLAAALRRLAADRVGFLEQLSELDALVGRVLAGGSPRSLPSVEWRRWVHTIKGSSAMLELHGISAACGRIEESVGESGAGPSGDVLDALRTRWAAVRDPLAAELAASDKTTVVDVDALTELAGAIGRGEPGEALLAKVDGMLQEPVQKRLHLLAKHVEWLADRTGKTGVAVSVQANGVMIERRGWGPLWAALVHVVRNAVAHGIETPCERLDAGKPAIGNVRLSASERAGAVLIEISDDGRGIDWEAVRAAAISRGVEVRSEEDLEAALFTDGISTTSSPNDISGRGEGLAAVLAAAKTLGGSVSISTSAGVGTTFALRLPRRSHDDGWGTTEANRASPTREEIQRDTGAAAPNRPAAGGRHERASLIPFLASSLGVALSEQLVVRCAAELEIEDDSFTVDTAVSVCDRIAQEPGLVGIAARFARTRIASTWGARARGET